MSGTEPAAGSSRPTPPNLHRDLLADKEHDHGGLGTIRAHRFYDRDRAASGVRFIDLAVLPPGTSIGRHRHGDDQETYLVLRGSGLMYRDGARFRVRTGDVVANRPYGEHGLLNDGDEDLHLLVVELSGPPHPTTPRQEADHVRDDD